MNSTHVVQDSNIIIISNHQYTHATHGADLSSDLFTRVALSQRRRVRRRQRVHIDGDAERYGDLIGPGVAAPDRATSGVHAVRDAVLAQQLRWYINTYI